MTKEELINSIRNAEYFIEQNAPYYHAMESECPDSFKFLMLLNGWHNPFIALNELLKVIYTNEMLLKKKWNEKGLQESLPRNGKADPGTFNS